MPRWTLFINKASLIGILSLPLWIIWGYVIFTEAEKEPPAIDALVAVDGVLSGQAVEDVGKSRQDFRILFEGAELWYVSSLTYPAKFLQGTETTDHLSAGLPATVYLEPQEHARESRRNRLTGMRWKTMVGLTVDGIVHLDPVEHYLAHQENSALGKLIVPIFAVLSMILIVGGYFKEKKARRGAPVGEDSFAPTIKREGQLEMVDSLKLISGHFREPLSRRWKEYLGAIFFIVLVPGAMLYALLSEGKPIDSWNVDQWTAAAIGIASPFVGFYLLYRSSESFEFTGTDIIIRRRGSEFTRIAIELIESVELTSDHNDNRFMKIKSRGQDFNILLFDELEHAVHRARFETQQIESQLSD